MITYKISSGTRIGEAGKAIYVKDLTGNVGDITYEVNPDNPTSYTDVTNTTGYSPTEPREEVALFLYAYVNMVGGRKEVAVETYDPYVVTEWLVVPPQDGWITFELHVVKAIPNYLEAGMINGDLIYDPTIDKIVVMMDDEYTFVENVRIFNSLAATTDKLHLSHNIQLLTDINNNKNDLLFAGGKDTKNINRYQNIYNNLRGVLEGTFYEYQRGNKELAQRNIEYINNNITL